MFTPLVAPDTPLQERIATIWGDLFGIDSVGIDDGFFELGGQSLHAAQAAVRIRSTLPVQLSVGDVLTSRTVRRLAELVEEKLTVAVSEMTDADAEALLKSLATGDDSD